MGSLPRDAGGGGGGGEGGREGGSREGGRGRNLRTCIMCLLSKKRKVTQIFSGTKDKDTIMSWLIIIGTNCPENISDETNTTRRLVSPYHRFE